MFSYFGYDYYLYIGSHLTYDEMKKIVNEQGLYIEKRKSPYKVNYVHDKKWGQSVLMIQ